MKKAKVKYNLLVNSGKWGARSPEQEEVIALEAEAQTQGPQAFCQTHQQAKRE